VKRPFIIFAVLSLFSGAIAPELGAATAQKDLPACCRGNGKHMCSVRTRNAVSHRAPLAPQVDSLCPYASRATRLAVSPGPVTNFGPILLCSSLELHPLMILADPSTAGHSLSDRIRPRGPPSLSS